MSDTYDDAERLLRDRQDRRAGLDHPSFAKRPGFGKTGDLTISFESGLPLTMRAGMPLVPVLTKERRLQLTLKRLLLDVPLSMLALIVLSPLLLGVALMIKLTSKGPVLFSQQRVGLNGEEFRMLKFRSMRTDACDDSGLSQVTADDDRVTSIGRFMRSTSIDELPQLWNILIGDMAIIGPRPMVPGQKAAGQDYRELVPYYDFRHLVKPGLSGWAQANGLRGPTTDLLSARQRIDHDCAYVQNFSLKLDTKAILRTILLEFLTGSGL